MDIGDCRVAFATEKNENKLLSTIVIIMTKIYSFVSNLSCYQTCLSLLSKNNF